MKKCYMCKKYKNNNAFSKNVSRCKICDKEYSQQRYIKKGKKRPINYIQLATAYKKKYPEQHRAHQSVKCALESGRLKKPSICSICKKKLRLSAHHKNYSKRFDILWVCSSCHKKLHV